MRIVAVASMVIGLATLPAAPATAAEIDSGTVAGVVITPDTVTAGTIAQGVVTLVGAVADDTVVALESTDTTVATVRRR